MKPPLKPLLGTSCIKGWIEHKEPRGHENSPGLYNGQVSTQQGRQDHRASDSSVHNTDTVQAILNLEKGCELGKPFKEHVAEPYVGAHSEFVRMGIYYR